MKKLLKVILFVIAVPLLYIVGCILLGQLTYYSPAGEIVLNKRESPSKLADSTYSAMIWNIGYGGLGKDMSFFYDGGERVRPKREWHEEYLSNIRSYIEKNEATDFILLQEVDEKAKRTYGTNEVEQLAKIKMHSDVALNYKVNFIPIPLLKPLGPVKSGLQSLTDHIPRISMRYQFPGSYGWPNKLFFLRRCFLVQRFDLKDKEAELVIINTHNSAYDDGSLKQEEMDFLKIFLEKEYAIGHYVVVGGDWNQLPPGSGNGSVDDNYLDGWKWAYDESVRTNRSLEKPYDGSNVTKVIDFFLVSPNIEVLNVEGADLDFQWSDHQPVFLDFKLLRKET